MSSALLVNSILIRASVGSESLLNVGAALAGVMLVSAASRASMESRKA